MHHKLFILPFLAISSLAAWPVAHSETAPGNMVAVASVPLQMSMLTPASDSNAALGNEADVAGEERASHVDASGTIQRNGQSAEASLAMPASDAELLKEDVSQADVSQADSDLSQAELEKLRKRFVQAEKAAKKGQKSRFFRLSSQLEDYPLYPYLQYQWLSRHLSDSKRINAFLAVYGDTRYGILLKRKRLSYLGKKRQWQAYQRDFIEWGYENTTNSSLQCYYRRAQYNTAKGDAALRDAALAGARELWVVGHSQPKVCDPLFRVLKKSDYFTTELVWQRFDAAMRNNKTRLAGYIKKDLPATERKTADFWLKLHRNPGKYLPELLNQSQTEHAGQMFADAVKRYAGRDVYQAIDVWDNNRELFNISRQDRNRVERRLAMKLAYKGDVDAYDRLGALELSDHRSQTLRIRLALQEQNWQRVIEAIGALDEKERNSEKWQYWLARAWQETGRPVQADEILSELSQKRDFYGYLAAEMLDRPYQLAHEPLDVSARDIQAVRDREAFRMAYEFKMLDRERDAKLQWWHALKQLDRSEVPAAAMLAQQWGWDEIAIFTIAKVKYWDDVELRFPRAYAEQIYEKAAENDLDPVILFGLIRRESAFNNDAHSPVGARGLMQLMPKTARQVARELNQRWRGSNSLYDPEKNLTYGAYYYQKLLTQFNGNYALALAAYNAGPSRVKQWLPDETMPADIWIETIPFRETREYVTTVLVYSMIYRQLLDSSSQLTLNELTPKILPLQEVAAAF